MGLQWIAGFFTVLSILFLNAYVLLFFSLKAKRSRVLYHFILTNGLVFLWLSCQLIELQMPFVIYQTWFQVINLLPFCFIAPIWLLFCAELLEYQSFFTVKKTVLLFVLPFLNYSIGVTNPWHHLYYDTSISGNGSMTYQTFFWSNVIVSYLYIGTSIFFLLQYYRRGNKTVKTQAVLLILASTLPLVANLLNVTKIIALPMDITSVSLAVPLLVFAIAGYRYEFMDIIPFALQKIIENIGEGILVTDLQGKVIFYNKKLAHMLNLHLSKHMTIRQILSPDNRNIEPSVMEALHHVYNDNLNYMSKIDFQLGNAYFSLKLQALLNSKGEILGKILIFRDITEYKQIQILLEEKAQMSATLATEKERIRLARDIHDTVGHSMTLLISLLEVSKIHTSSNAPEAVKKIDTAILTAKEGLSALRTSVKGLKERSSIAMSLEQRMTELIDSTQRLGVDIQFSILGTSKSLSSEIEESLYRACQESITNAIRHGHASQIAIILQYTAHATQLSVMDNGIGTTSFSKGFGLTAMEERISSVGGTLSLSSDEETGFIVRISIPKKGDTP